MGIKIKSVVLWGIILISLFYGTLYAQQKPNIILVLIDDMGWKDVTYMGSQYYETPNIDSLAASGMKFMSAYSNAPNCAPTRAALNSGMYAPRTGVYTVKSSARGESAKRRLVPIKNNTTLSSYFFTLGEAMQSAGYKTAYMGKWHLGEGDKTGPRGQGFDVNIAGNKTGFPAGGYFSPYQNPQISDGIEGEYLTDRLSDEAVQFIATHKSTPFFLFLSHYAVHGPIQAKAKLTKKYQDKSRGHRGHRGHKRKNTPQYAAMIQSIDEGIGNIKDQLTLLGITDNTIIIFCSDNGGHAKHTTMQPLRGSKGTFYEGGIRIPFYITWPGKIKPESISEVPIMTTDIYPTLVELAAARIPDEKILDGESLVPLLLGTGELKREALFWHFPAYLAPNHRGQGLWRTTPGSIIRMGDYKLLEYFEFGQLELYNIREDIGETKNLALDMPGKVYTLREKLYTWRAATNAPVPYEKNPDYDEKYKPITYISYYDIKPRLKRGCTDIAYNEYDAEANILDASACQTIAKHQELQSKLE